MECDGVLKYYLKFGGTIERCPDCDHHCAIAKLNCFVDDLTIDNDKNWDLYCMCCGAINNALFQ